MKIDKIEFKNRNTLILEEYSATIKYQVISIYKKTSVNNGLIMDSTQDINKCRFNFEISKRSKYQNNYDTEIIIKEGNYKNSIFLANLSSLQKIYLRIMFKRYYVLKESFWLGVINILVEGKKQCQSYLQIIL